jgi:predicted DNA-binding protein (MmcQ/YjbR family)
MNIEEFRAYCLSLPYTDEHLPFGDDTLVFRVGGMQGKLFALTSFKADPLFCNLKCNPERAIDLREEYDQIRPGYHMNKQHWNSVYIEDGLSNKLLRQLIDESYQLVYKSLTLKLKKELESNE